MKKLMMMIMFCLLVISICGCSKAEADINDSENFIGAAEIDRELTEMYDITTEDMSSFKIEGDLAIMNGDISKDTIRQVKKLISDYPKVKTIVMQYVGGSVDDESNLIASQLVREAGMNTLVPKDGLIASGGTDFFCAGVLRTAEEGSQVGVHSWAGDGVENAALLEKNDQSHKKYITYYEKMGMPDPEGFYFFTINAAPADDIYFMSQEELKSYGLVTTEE